MPDNVWFVYVGHEIAYIENFLWLQNVKKLKENRKWLSFPYILYILAMRFQEPRHLIFGYLKQFIF